MKKRKFISMFAILLMAIFAMSCCFFFACGSDDDEEKDDETKTNQDSETNDDNDGEPQGSDQNTETLTINPATLTLDKENPTGIVTATEHEGIYIWASSDEAIATVSDSTTNTATITAVAVGTATITVKVGKLSATCNVTVTYANMTDDDAANLFAAIEKVNEYEGSFTAVNTWIWYEYEEWVEDGEADFEGEVDTELNTYSYDAESGYLVYKYEDEDIETDGNGETVNAEYEYTYYVPNDNGETLTVYFDDGETKEKSTIDSGDDEYSDYMWNSSVAWITDLDNYYNYEDTRDETQKTLKTVEGLREYLFGREISGYYESDIGEWDMHVELSEGNTIYSITYSVSEVIGDDDYEDGRWSGEYSDTYEIEFCVNADGYIYKYANKRTEIDNRTYYEDEDDDEGEYDNETLINSYVWEISYNFDYSLMLTEEEMAGYEED